MLKALLICAVASASIAACSTAAQPRPDAKAAAVSTSRCSRESASGVSTPGNECSASPVRTYSHDDVERTGQINAGDALQRLDPSISVHH